MASEPTAHRYLVAGCKPWNRRVFQDTLSSGPGQWHLITEREQLTPEYVEQLAPYYIFFLHWSWLVPASVVERHECVCFHMTDVPYGRGGSPLQNLIVRGHRQTRLTALRMVAELDAGPVYLKEDLSLEGNAEEIYLRATRLAARMIRRIIDEQPRPVPQSGKVVEFKRRKRCESELCRPASLEQVHDFIRMLDAEGYPRAFFIHEGFRYELGRAALYDGQIRADVTISPVESKPA